MWKNVGDHPYDDQIHCASMKVQEYYRQWHVKKVHVGILGYSIPLKDTWDSILMTNSAVVEILQTPFS